MIRLTGIRATVHFRSGRRRTFKCGTITITSRGNDLEGIKVERHQTYPLYLRLDEVEAITTRRVFWPRWES